MNSLDDEAIYIGPTSQRMAKAHKARGAAQRRFIELHRAEWDEIHNEERLRLGLPPVGEDAQAKRAHLLQMRVQQLEEELADLKNSH